VSHFPLPQPEGQPAVERNDARIPAAPKPQPPARRAAAVK
jgi:hypothetical protein